MKKGYGPGKCKTGPFSYDHRGHEQVWSEKWQSMACSGCGRMTFPTAEMIRTHPELAE